MCNPQIESAARTVTSSCQAKGWGASWDGSLLLHLGLTNTHHWCSPTRIATTASCVYSSWEILITMERVCSSAAQQLWRECAAQQLNNSSSFENLAPDSQPQVKKLDLSPLVRIAKEYSGTLYSSSSSSQRCKCKSTQRSSCIPQAENWVASEQAWPIRTELQNAPKKIGHV